MTVSIARRLFINVR